jgi:alpha-glucosidase (family GH31 glycosyl hydrolase)
MFGFQMIGADICGFLGGLLEELCARWIQLGALYPFSRAHSSAGASRREPYVLGEIILTSTKINLKLRYSLLKYYYYLFVNKKGLGTIWRALFFEFPSDPKTYNNEIADTQFLIGPNLMSAPILEPGVTEREAYFPEVNWYNLETGEKYYPGTAIIKGIGLADRVPLFIR